MKIENSNCDVAKIPLREDPSHEPWQTWVESQIGVLGDDDARLLGTAYAHFLGQKSTELPPELFGSIHGKSKSRLLGITYTPTDIREQLVNRVLTKLIETRQPADLKISDPCCGSGTFTITSLDFLMRQGVDARIALEQVLYFSDIDRISVGLALVNIRAWLENRKIDCGDIKLNASCRDFFSDDRCFDAFITNPPYVKLQNLDVRVRAQLRSSYPKLFVGALGLSAIFLKRMIDLLAPDGVLGVITQNNFFSSNSAAPLRQELGPKVLEIANFGSDKVFDSVSAYACLLYVCEKNQATFKFRRIQSKADICAQGETLPTAHLRAGKWRLGSKQELQELQRLESAGVPLGVACRISVGIATLLDKAFFVTEKDGVWIGTSPSGQDYAIENEAVCPLIKVSELGAKVSSPAPQRGVIFPYEVRQGKAEAILAERLEQEMPNASRYLFTWKDALQRRDKGRKPLAPWHLWGRQQSMTAFGPKLLTKTFSRGPSFYLDETDSLFANGYAVFQRDPAFDLRYVQAVLNSRVFYYYAKLTSFEIEGNYQCYQKNFIERFCLPVVDKKIQIELASDSIRIENFLLRHFDLSEQAILALEL